MKIGIVGVGPWGRTLAHKFASNGHQIAWHCRKKTRADAGPELGERVTITELLKKQPDAIVLASNPQVVRETLFYATAAGIPVLATKPVLGAAGIMTDGNWQGSLVMVDYVHLHSPLVLKLRALMIQKETFRVFPKRINCEFYGNGPVRTFDPLWDYGPHAAAMLLDLIPASMTMLKKVVRTSTRPGRAMYDVEAARTGVEVRLVIGSDSEESRTSVSIEYDNGTVDMYTENYPKATLTSSTEATVVASNHDPLGSLVDKFASLASPAKTKEAMEQGMMELELSSRVEAFLTTIQKAASESR